MIIRKIKNKVQGVPIQDDYINHLVVYYKCATELGWSKKDIDESDPIFIADLLTLADEVKREQNRRH